MPCEPHFFVISFSSARVTKSGALDDVVRVNVKTKTEEPPGGPSKRESSHDYD